MKTKAFTRHRVNSFIPTVSTPEVEVVEEPIKKSVPTGAPSFKTLNHVGVLLPMVGEAGWLSDSDATVTKIEAFLGTVSAGGDVSLLLNKNGVMQDNIDIATGETSVIMDELNISLVDGDVLTMDIVAVGSDYPGKDLTLRLTYNG